MRFVPKFIRKIAIVIAGALLMLIGVILIPLPGPGVLVIVFGLFVLSLEFEWADRYFQRLKAVQKRVIEAAKNRRNKNTPTPKS